MCSLVRLSILGFVNPRMVFHWFGTLLKGIVFFPGFGACPHMNATLLCNYAITIIAKCQSTLYVMTSSHFVALTVQDVHALLHVI